jgi:hypothetical protein
VTLTGGIDITGAGNFDSIVNTGTTNLKGVVILGDETGDEIAFKGRANTNLVPNADNVYDLGTSALNWKDIFVKGKIAAGATTIIGANQKLHANNTITNETILNTHLKNDGITVSSNTGTSSEVQLGDTLSVVSGTAAGVTVNYLSDTITISGVDASTAVKGVAKFDSDDFAVSSGSVSLKDATTGAVLAINGTANEVNVSRTNGTVTVGLPDDVTITSDLMVGGGVFISGNLTVSGTTTTVNTETINLADNIIKLNSNANTAIAPSENAGIAVARGNAANTQLIWNESNDRWTFTNNGTNYYNIPISSEYDNYGSWTASANSTTYTLGSGQTLTYTQGNDLDVMFIADKNMRIGHANITRTNNTSTAAPGYGGTFTAIDSITTNARGHVSAVNTKTVTIPASDNTNTTYAVNTSTATGGANFNLVAGGSGSGTQAINFVGSGATTVTRTDANTITVSSTDNNTTYSISVAAGADAYSEKVRLSAGGSGSGSDDIVLAVGAVDSVYGLTIAESSDTITFSHADTSTQASVNNSGRTYIQDITLDTYGHITAITSATETVTDTNTTYEINTSAATGGANFNLVAGGSGSGTQAINIVGSGATTVTRTDANTITVSSTDNNTTYSAGTGLDLTGTTFSVESDLRADVWQIGRDVYNYFVINATTHQWHLGATLNMQLDVSGNLDVEGNITAYSTVTSSDAKLKTNITKVENALDKIEQLVGVEFDWIKNGEHSAGVIAQDVEKVLPCAVSEVKNLNDDETHKSVNYNALFSIVIESIKELKKEIQDLKANK